MNFNKRINLILKQAFHLRHEIYTWLAYRLPLFPHRFVFILTNRCNLSCKNCFQDRQEKKDTLTKEQWIALSDELPKSTRITITGGEPLLAIGFQEIFASIGRKHYCNLITNGILLTEEIVDLLLSLPKFKVLAVSIDNLKSCKSDIRSVNERQWLNLEKMLKYFIVRRNAKGSQCILEIKTLVLDENADCLYDIHRYCMEELQADHHTFQFLKGNPLQHSDRSFDFCKIFENYDSHIYNNFDSIIRELNRIKEYNVLHNKIAFLHPVVADLNTDKKLGDISFLNGPAFRKHLFKPCKFPWSSIHVNYDGQLFPCLSISLGNVKEKPVRRIIKEKPYKDFLTIIREHGHVNACNGCGWLRPYTRKNIQYGGKN